jgi:hypothetical protein
MREGTLASEWPRGGSASYARKSIIILTSISTGFRVNLEEKNRRAGSADLTVLAALLSVLL